jgi:hypothetical protein
MRGKKSNFDALLEEIGVLSKAVSLDTAKDDAKIADAAGEDDRDEAQDEMHPSDRAILKLFRQMSGVIQAQGRAIRDLQARVGGRDQGRGAPDFGKPLTKALDRPEAQVFLAKALEAQRAGRLAGVRVAEAEAYLNAGKPLPLDLVQAVLAEAA